MEQLDTIQNNLASHAVVVVDQVSTDIQPGSLDQPVNTMKSSHKPNKYVRQLIDASNQRSGSSDRFLRSNTVQIGSGGDQSLKRIKEMFLNQESNVSKSYKPLSSVANLLNVGLDDQKVKLFPEPSRKPLHKYTGAKTSNIFDEKQKSAEPLDLKISEDRIQPVINPVVVESTTAIKKTKSILKTPSSFSEKSIHFDDHVDVIPIERINEEDSSNEAARLLDQEPSNNIVHLLPTQPSVSKQISPAVKEIDLIKKRLLEPKQQQFSRFNSVADLLLTSNDTQQFTPTTRNRIFVKSPTPIRELPSNSSSFGANYLSVPFFTPSETTNEPFSSGQLSPKNNRQRFVKKISPAFRSQSVDLSKMFNMDNSVSPPPPPAFNTSQRKKSPLINKAVSPVTRPSLTRQNALSRSSQVSKSLAVDLDQVGVSEAPYKHRKQHHRKSHHKHHHRHNHHRKHGHTGRQRSLTSSSSSSMSHSVSSDSTSETLSTSSSSSSIVSALTERRKSDPRSQRFRGNDLRASLANLNFYDQPKASSINNRGLKLTGAYYSSDDSVCGIPKSRKDSNNNKRSPFTNK